MDIKGGKLRLVIIGKMLRCVVLLVCLVKVRGDNFPSLLTTNATLGKFWVENGESCASLVLQLL